MAEQLHNISDEVIRAIEAGKDVAYAKHRTEAVGLDKGDPYVIVRGNLDFWSTVTTALALAATTPNSFSYPFESIHKVLDADIRASLTELNKVLDKDA